MPPALCASSQSSILSQWKKLAKWVKGKQSEKIGTVDLLGLSLALAAGGGGLLLVVGIVLGGAVDVDRGALRTLGLAGAASGSLGRGGRGAAGVGAVSLAALELLQMLSGRGREKLVSRISKVENNEIET